MLADWSGDLPDGTIWSNTEVQRIVGNVRVPAGATLTIEPGAIVKVNPGWGFVITVEGTIVGQGTSGAPIVITSFRDDTGPDGILGTADDHDSNSDGPTVGSSGDWGGIRIEASSAGSLLEYFDMRYPGAYGIPALRLIGGGMALRHGVIQESLSYGVRIEASDPVLTNIAFRNNRYEALSMDLASSPTIAQAVFVNNRINGLYLDGGSLPADAVWDDPDVVYYLSGRITVPEGRTLTVSAGQIVKTGWLANGLLVHGRLLVDGKADLPVLFTSSEDDTAGGDTGNDGGREPRPGDWGGITMTSTSAGNVIRHAEIRYGGGHSNETILVDGGELTLRDSVVRESRANGLVARNRAVTVHKTTFRDNGLRGVVLESSDGVLTDNTFVDNATIGLRIENSRPRVAGNRWEGNGAAALSMDLLSQPVITGVTLVNNRVNGLHVDGGTISGDTVWDNPDIVYALYYGIGTSAAYAVAPGATLTIAAGQVLKLGVYGLVVDGRLLANGTSERPVVFTSPTDDSAGGDTNNDGPVNVDQQGNWTGVEFTSTSSGNVLEHAEIRYGGGVRNDGLIFVDGANVAMRSSVIRGGATSAIYTRGPASLRVENSVLVENVRSDTGHASGIHADGGEIAAVNNTIAANDRGITAAASTVTLINNLITHSNRHGIELSDGAVLAAHYNDVFNPAATRGNYVGIADLTGTLGNRSVDPKYFNPAASQYQLKAGSPVIDAGTSNGAPERDRDGRWRFDAPGVPNQGGGIRPYFDMGAIESQEIASSDVDLVARDIVAPLVAIPDQVVTVQWTVANLGTGAAIGPWSDAIYVSLDPAWDIGDRLLGRVAGVSDLGPNQSVVRSLDVTLRVEEPGPHYLIARTNDAGDVFEGTAVTNNAGIAAAPTEFPIMSLSLGVPHADTFAEAGQSKYYALEAPPGETLVLALDSAGRTGVTELYVRRNRLPSRDVYDFQGTSRVVDRFGSPDKELVIPLTGPGTYYVLAYSDSGAAATSPFTLTPSIAGFSVRASWPGLTFGGPFTLRIDGAGFTPDARVELDSVWTSRVFSATDVYYVDASQLYATFAPINAGADRFTVRVIQGAASVESPTELQWGDVFRKLPPTRLRVAVVAPDRVRGGQAIPFTVQYQNTGVSDLPAPLLVVEARNGLIQHPEQPGIQSATYQFLATSDAGPAGVLPPSAFAEIRLRIVPTGTEDVSIDVWQADPEPRIDWDALKDDMRPPDVPVSAWDVIFAHFKESVAPEVSDVREYQTALARHATHLGRIGERVRSVDRLLALELGRAGDFGAIARRHRRGAFGYGFPDLSHVSAETNADGSVTIRMNEWVRPFHRSRKGFFLGLSGDRATLTSTEGAVRLREADGTVFQFRSDGKLDSIEDPNGNRVITEYDGGRVVGFTDSMGNRETYEYNARGMIRRITDSEGRVTGLTYDAYDQLVEIGDAAGTTRYTYLNGLGAAREHAMASITGPDGVGTHFEYDANGRVVRTYLDGGAGEILTEYGDVGRVTITNGLGDRSTVLRNEHGDAALVEDSTGRVTRYRYDLNRNLTEVIGPDGAMTTTTYDAFKDGGNLARIEDPLGNRVEFVHASGVNRLLSMRDPIGRTTRFAYDTRGNATGVVYPDGTADRALHDVKGNPVESINARGQSIDYAYDGKNRLIRKTFPDGSGVDFAYDDRSNLLRATDAGGSIVFTYDAADRPTSVTYANGRSLGYAYDAAGRRVRSTDASGSSTRYAYDALGRLERLSDDADRTIVAYTYDALGRVARQDRGNGTWSTHTYDISGPIDTITHFAPDGAVLARFDYDYDPVGRAVRLTTLDGVTAYDYDGVGQLTRVVLPGGRTIQYQYDAVGNRVAVVDDGATTDYSINTMNAYTGVGGTTFTYDADGNPITRLDSTGTTMYAYDVEGRLRTATSASDHVEYEYDALGNRAAVIHNGTRTEYLIDPAGIGDVVGEFDGAGQLVARYVHGIGLASRFDAGGDRAYYDADAVGNIIGVTGPAGSYVNEYAYLPFGERLREVESVANPFEFVGALGVMEDPGGLEFMRARYYDASLGRFMTPDPIGFAGGDANLYAYVANGPIHGIDPGGTFITAPLWVIGAGLGAAFNTTAYIATQAWNDQEITLRGALGAGTSGAIYGGIVGATGGMSLVTPSVVRAGAYMAAVGGLSNAAGYIVEHAGNEKDEGSLSGLMTTTALGVATGWIPWNMLSFKYAASGWMGGNAARSLFSRALRNGVTIREIFGSAHRSVSPYIMHHVQSLFDSLAASYAAGYLPGILLSDSLNEQFKKVENLLVSVFTAEDPNDIGGPAGVGPERYIRADERLGYTILFENKPEATAAAVHVVVTESLDADLDWTTFELGDFGFGDLHVTVPPGRRSYRTRLDLRATRGEYLDFAAGIDLETGVARWEFTSIDPLTGEMATSVDAGFLPPNRTPPEGDGFANYSIRALDQLATGTALSALASIVFDTNAPLETPEFMNTVDAEPPSSRVDPLPTVSGASILVTWSGADDPGGSGIQSYDLFVSKDGGPFEPWLAEQTGASATYVGEAGRKYAFYSVARDRVDRLEEAPEGPDATTRVTDRPWRNAEFEFDVSGDGRTNTSDLVLLLRRIGTYGAQRLPAPRPDFQPPPYFDVSGDDWLTAFDVVLLLRHLRETSAGEGSPINAVAGGIRFAFDRESASNREKSRDDGWDELWRDWDADLWDGPGSAT